MKNRLPFVMRAVCGLALALMLLVVAYTTIHTGASAYLFPCYAAARVEYVGPYGAVGAPPGVGPAPDYRPAPQAEIWPVIVIGTVERELGSIEAIRPDTADWPEPMIEDWIVVEVSVQRVLKGEVPTRITVQRLPRGSRGTVGTFYLLRPAERVLLFLDEPPDSSTPYLLSWSAGFLKISLADSPAAVDSSKTSALDIIHAELAHGLEADDAYVVHGVMDAFLDQELFSDKAVPALKKLAKSADPWLSLHALSVLSLRTGDQDAFEAVVRRAEAGDYTDQVGVLEPNGITTVDVERASYLYNGPGSWISHAFGGAKHPDSVPTLNWIAESLEMEPWLRKEALGRLTEFGFPDQPSIKLWRLFLEDSDPSLQYWAVDHMRTKFSNHPAVQNAPELNTKLNEEDFDQDPDKYVDLWLGFLNAFETEQAGKGK